MQIVHVTTVIQTVFGTIDDNGNVINKQPVSVEVATLDECSFTKACDALVEAKAKLSATPKE